MKGFLGGVSVGALVAVAGAAMWSLSAPLPRGVEVGTSTSGATTQPVTVQNSVPETSGQRDADLVEVAPSTPQSGATEDQSPVAVLDTDPGNRPQVSIPESAASHRDIDNIGDMPPAAEGATLPQVSDVASGGQAVGTVPDAPKQEDTPDVSTETAELPVAQAVSESPSATQQAETATDPSPRSQPVADSIKEPSSAGDVASGSTPAIDAPNLGQAPAATARPSLGQTTGTAAVESEQAATTPQVTDEQATDQQVTDDHVTDDQVTGQDGAPSQPMVSVDPAQGASGAQQSETGLELDPVPPTPDTIASAADKPETGPRIGTPVVPLTERSNSPSLISSDQQAATGTSPFEANSQPYVVQDNRPLMSIVLIDDAAAIGAEALAEFPYPLTFAISPDDPRAEAKMQARRAAGFEVLILADLPRAAAPQDVETALPIWMQKLPQAVGFLEGVDSGFQGNRPLADQVVTVLRSAGYGMVTQNNGLNTVQKLALRDGMPSGVVFRDFDGAGQNPRAIRRFLDQAAFRARQEGAVIMLGRLRPDTISALLLWGLQDRAAQVGLAPISAALKANLTPDG